MNSDFFPGRHVDRQGSIWRKYRYQFIKYRYQFIYEMMRSPQEYRIEAKLVGNRDGATVGHSKDFEAEQFRPKISR
jgi:hypothetical protein